ncbi:hypothetical protein HDU97_004257 [Phlyctochytrium planicorne]|nr:hypothetical protein HDU97_004257 [Phlyctochytrium planicorne]
MAVGSLSHRLSKVVEDAAKAFSAAMEIFGLIGFMAVCIFEFILICGLVEQGSIYRAKEQIVGTAKFRPASLTTLGTRPVFFWCLCSDVAKDFGLLFCSYLNPRIKKGDYIVVMETSFYRWVRRPVLVALCRYSLVLLLAEHGQMQDDPAYRIACILSLIFSLPANFVGSFVFPGSDVKGLKGRIVVSLMTARVIISSLSSLATGGYPVMIFNAKILFGVAFRSLSDKILEAEMRVVRDAAKTPELGLVEFRKFTRSSQMLDPEEALELNSVYGHNLLASLYNVSAYFIVFTSSRKIFYICVFSNIIIEICVRSALSRLRRKMKMREMAKHANEALEVKVEDEQDVNDMQMS